MHKILTVFIIPFIFSCSIQKRHYQKGYFVSWHKHSSAPAENKEKNTQQTIGKKQIATEIVSKDAENKIEFFASSSNELNVSHFTKQKKISGGEDSCDVIVYKDGSEVKAKISEISSTTIKYKKCDMAEGPMYVVNKTQIFMIKYANGTREVVRAPENIGNPAVQNKNPKVRPPKKNTRLSTAALIFAILGLYGLELIGGIVAIILASIQLYRIRMYPDVYGGERKARAALIMGIIGVAVWVSLVLVFLLFAM